MKLDLSMQTQPDGVSCGPTCLHALYQYHADPLLLEQIIQEVPYLETGGTLAVLLACHALQRGYQATLHSFNLHVLDPTWFLSPTSSQISREISECDAGAEQLHFLLDKLRIQVTKISDPKIKTTTMAYIRFLELGGQLHFNEITFDMLRVYLDQKLPILSGLSATYLHKNMRDYTSEDNQVVYDEWLGVPSGHFVLVRGYELSPQQLHIADPYKPHPLSSDNYYTVDFGRWLHAHLLGIITYDAELVVLKPYRS